MYLLPIFLIATIIFYISYDDGSRAQGSKYGTDEESVIERAPTMAGNHSSQEISDKPILKINGTDNASMVLLPDKNGQDGPDLPAFLRDPQNLCTTIFKCKKDFSTGWGDNNSIQISTTNAVPKKWSRLIGQVIHVVPNERYHLVMHMKLNSWAKWSHISIQGFNESSKKWEEISTCGYLKGPLEWQEETCSITIENNITKIRPIFKAGWSKKEGRDAITWFDYAYITKFKSYIADPNLKYEVVYDGLKSPTNMAFLGTNDFLVIEKDGTVQRILNGVKSTNPLLELNVANYEDGGLLGIAVSRIKETTQSNLNDPSTYVYLYFTELKKLKENVSQKDDIAANRLYRYQFVNNTLINPKLLLDLPAGYHHDGGSVLIGPDNQSVYLSVGDVENESYKVVPNKALNNKTGDEPDGSGGILRFTLDGQPINGGILGNKYPLNLYYAYGIRNSFGMAFDPLGDKLWITDNGHDTGDEINMLEAGFNGGWNKVQGIWPFNEGHVPNATEIIHNPSGLVDFDGKGKYYDPQFTWNQTVGPTALIFLSTDKLGKAYENDMFVGGVDNGRIYHFDLNKNRNELLLEGPLKDKVADDDKELENNIFAGGFGLITDLDVGPDGYLYFVVFNEGKIYRIVPADHN